MGIFRFLFTPNDRGVGTGNLAFARSQHVPDQSIYGPRYNVRGQLSSTRKGAVKLEQLVPSVGIEGNGAAIQGQFRSAGLVKSGGE